MVVVGLLDSDSLTTRPTVGNLVVQAPGASSEVQAWVGTLGK